MKNFLRSLLVMVLAVGVYRLANPPATAMAGWQPFTYNTPVIAQSGSMTSPQTICASVPVTGYYAVQVFAATNNAVALSTVTVTVNFTYKGVARQLAYSSLSLGNASAAQPQYQIVHADAGTAITFTTVAVGLGTYDIRTGWKPAIT